LLIKNQISVIISYKEPTPFIQETINSLKNQTIAGELEIIMIQDTGRGVSATRNLGLDKAHGEYIFFLDADDIFYRNDTLEMVRAVIQDNEQLSFVYGDLVIGNEKLNPITYHMTPRFHASHINTFLSSGGMILLLSILFRNDDNIRFNENLRFGEDLDYILRKTIGKDGKYIRLPIGLYRQHGESLSRKRTPGKAQMIAQIADVYKNFLEGHPQLVKNKIHFNKIMARQYLNVAHMLHHIYYRRESFVAILKALRHFPYLFTKKFFRAITEFILPVFIARNLRAHLIAWKIQRFHTSHNACQ